MASLPFRRSTVIYMCGPYSQAVDTTNAAQA